MKNIKWARSLALSLLFLITPLPLPTISTGQSQSTQRNLENTEWLVTTMDFYSPPNTNFVYLFGKQDDVGYWFTTVIPHGPQTTFNVVTQSWETKYYAPTIERMYDLNGTYKQKGSSVRLEFSDHIINATIKGNRMEGEATSKLSNKKAKWAAEKTSEPTERNNRTQNAPSARNNPKAGTGSNLVDQLRIFNTNSVDCLPKDGTLIVKMKDGSIRRIDLSQAEEITIER